MKVVFGDKIDNVEYLQMEGSYAIIRNESNEYALVNVSGNYFLPGGGKEPNENEIECLKRELLEELGWEISRYQRIGESSEYIISRKNEHICIAGAFYLVGKYSEIKQAREKDHLLVWKKYDEAYASLTRKAQKWALKKSLG